MTDKTKYKLYRILSPIISLAGLMVTFTAILWAVLNLRYGTYFEMFVEIIFGFVPAGLTTILADILEKEAEKIYEDWKRQHKLSQLLD